MADRSEAQLRKAVIKLAFDKPELREHLLPLVKEAAGWAVFTKRTEEPKLSWLERQLDRAGIPHRRRGQSFHAPILEVARDRLDDAWDILDPVDDVPDDDPRFSRRAHDRR